ncbi:uncharacterized protein LOC124596387 isoform X1 [Schistocerca americana]|uniref:uncharacterized protein LOC124596387 isoform X1 n=1 Tax=Schistocerca americana TaxID=7009 RepID=UPI001F4F4C07|nr:uncharacterized protein LOC124596387 isoform X1 [Schistocerca americana]XP_047109247.1 uncharacterized protein LOC124777781 isoform X1 [Schistocerca piceifrons]
MQADSQSLPQEADELSGLIRTLQDEILADIKNEENWCQPFIAGIFSIGNEEAKEFVMSLYDNSMLDEMRKTYESILKTDERHKKNMRDLRKLCETGLEHLSLEEAFIKFGGDRMQNVPKNDLEEIASQLVDSPEIMLSKETKEKLFRAWEERLNRHHHRHHLSTSPTKLQ